MNNDCWPDWLKRRNAQRYGPDFQGDIPYPIYQVQPAVLSADNPNTNSQVVNDGFYQAAAGQITAANAPTTIVHVMPNNTYDSININAFVSPPVALAPTVPDIGVPIFFSFDKPGRITVENALPGSLEAFICTARPFDPTDPSGIASCTIMPQVMLNHALNLPAAIYTTAFIATVKTNRPFWFWFNDGIATLPQGGGATAPVVNFKVSWYVIGR